MIIVELVLQGRKFVAGLGPGAEAERAKRRVSLTCRVAANQAIVAREPKRIR